MIACTDKSERTLRLSMEPFLYAALFMAVFAGFQGGRYYLANRLQELGIACALLLFTVGIWRALFRLNYYEWRAWAMRPVLLISGIMIVSGMVFSLNYEGKFINSVFSAREFLLAFCGPGIYLLCRTGLPLAKVERVIWLALFALIMNYLFFYFTMDLRQAFFSSDHTVSNLVTYDAWRGFRLKPPLFAIMVALLASMALLLQKRGALSKLASLLLIGLSAYIWSIVLFRSTLATMLLAILLYPVFFSHRNRLKLAILVTPLLIIAVPMGTSILVDNFLNADGGGIRAKAYVKGIEFFQLHPILGVGEDSAYGESYQDIVAPYFYPSDIGLVGIAFKYGVVGVFLYLFLHFKILFCLWKANLFCKSTDNRVNPLLWGLLMFMTAQTFNLVLNPGLAYAQGITAGSMAFALASLHLVRCQHGDVVSQLAPVNNTSLEPAVGVAS
ncbi:MAG: O-antigen ligase family protein [Pseudomonadota bacterium]